MIGGEFEIDLTKKGRFVEETDTYYYASGRAALYQIICSLNIKCVWLPDYLCISVVEAVTKAGCQVAFYELDDNLDPKMETLNPDKHDAILLIDYFGLKDLNEIENNLSSLYPDVVIVEDDVQAYYDFIEGKNQNVQYRFTSLRKTFAVIDGGLVYTKHQLTNATDNNTFSQYKLQAADMKFHRTESSDDSKYLALFEKGEEMIDENYDSRMSEESKALFAACDIDDVRRKRIANSKVILKGLNELGVKTIIPVHENKTPLFIPIYLDDRNKVRKAMFGQNIFCPVHWPLEGMKIKKGAEMAEHELSLIIDQRYTTEDMNRILQLLEENI